MKRTIFLCLILLTLFSCKNKEAKVYELVTTYNEANKDKSNDDLIQTKAFIKDKKNVAFDFILKTKTDTLSHEYKSKVNTYITDIQNKYELIKDLEKESINFKVRVYNAFGIKIEELPLSIHSKAD